MERVQKRFGQGEGAEAAPAPGEGFGAGGAVAGAGAAARTNIAWRGKLKVPPESSMTFTWQM
jgi:hypothetical protein